MPLLNWGGTYRYLADEIVLPASLDELLETIRRAGNVRVVGTRHTFSGISDAPTMIGLTALGERFELDEDASTVTIDGAMTYGRLAELLAPHGLALHNLASLAHLCVAGAVATGTHGSGDDNGNLATSVEGVEIATSAGELVHLRRGDAGFDGAVVSVGALGVTTALTLRLEPAFDVEQRVVENVPLDAFIADVDGVFASGYSVSAFCRWTDTVDQVWVKHRVGERREAPPVIQAGQPATSKRHPVSGADASACTEQFGLPGPWAERLPHFQLNALPSAGAEVQSEYFVPRAVAQEAIGALRPVGPQLAAAILACEMRTVAADSLWLSPCFGRDSLAFHFTWRPDNQLAQDAAAVLETALRPFDVRPHWGKLFTPGLSATSDYPRRSGALDLIEAFDPGGAFANDWLRAEGLRPA